jgi:Na+/melibiose symporter-like transporter
MTTFFIRGLTEEFGWTRAKFAAIQAVALWGVLAAPLAGDLIDRLGLRRVLVVGLALLTGLYLWAATMPHVAWGPLALFLAIQIVGQATATVPHTRAVASWFERRRGFALGIVITGVPIISALVSPLMAKLVDGGAWRIGYYLLAALVAGISLPAALLFVRERPRSFEGKADEPAAQAPGLELRQALGTRAFWLLMAAMALVNLPAAAFINQLVPMLTDRGMTTGTAAAMVSAYSLAMIAGRLGCGASVDRFQPSWVAAGFTLIPALGFMGMLVSSPHSVVLTFVCVALIGVQHGAEFDLLAYFTAQQFGLRRYGLIYSVGYVVVILSTSVALVAFAGAHDRTGSYNLALLGSAITLGLGAVCFALLPRKSDARVLAAAGL